MGSKKLRVMTLVVMLTLMFSARMTGADSQASKQKGVGYADWSPDGYTQPDADFMLAQLRATGASWISLLVTHYQDTIGSTVIQPMAHTPTDASLIHAIHQAHSLGLKVMLKPHLDLANDPTHWRGQIGQGFTEAQWTAWFASYRNFIIHFAQLAQAYGVDQFCVGTELGVTQHQVTRWRAVIAGIRDAYTGPITYASNWDDNNVGWWDAMDYIGVDAYYPLTNKDDPSIAELVAAWGRYTPALANLASTWNKPILFTEIGYRSQNGINQHPWTAQRPGMLDLQEQADTYQAAFEAVFNQPWFAGIFWWSWQTAPSQGGPCDQGQTPYRKPAENVLRSWYGAPPRPVTAIDWPGPQPDYQRTLDIYRDGLGTGWQDSSWDAAVNMHATSPVYSGTYSISTAAQPWGALSLSHASFDTSPYYWLEFHVRGSAACQSLRVFANDDQDTRLRNVPAGYYSENGSVGPDGWVRVRVPLSDLDAARRLIQKVTIRNDTDNPSTFWVDEVRLVAAVWRWYLPQVVQAR